MPPARPHHRLEASPPQQPRCSQDFARNPFGFIDLAYTLRTRPNRFIDLRGFARFFQE